jgi:hypothetical protein
MKMQIYNNMNKLHRLLVGHPIFMALLQYKTQSQTQHRISINHQNNFFTEKIQDNDCMYKIMSLVA